MDRVDGLARYTMKTAVHYRCLLAVIGVCCGPGAAADSSSALSAGLERETTSPLLALSHGGRWAAIAAHDDDTVVLVETASGKIRRLAAAGSGPPAAQWGLDDGTLIVTRGRVLSLFDPRQDRLIRVITSDAPLSAMEVSPDGRFVAVIAQHRLKVADLAKEILHPLTGADDPTVYEGDVDPVFGAEFNVDRHYVWSPDSRSIAYIETNFAGAEHIPLAGAPLPGFALKISDVHSGLGHTVARSDDNWPYLFRVSWSPDGNKLVYYRMNRLQTVAELRLFDGIESKTLLTERDSYWVTVPATPRYLADGQSIVVTSERSGQNHIYRYHLPSGNLQDLTPDGWNIVDLLPQIDLQDRIHATGTAGDRQNMQLLEIDARRGGLRRLTTEPGWHEAVETDKGAGFLDSYSTAASPPTLIWHPNRGNDRQLSKGSGRVERFQQEFTQFKMHDDTMIPARWFKPVSFDAGRKYPVIVYVSAGPNGSVAQNRWGGWPMTWNRSMVEHGYVVLALDPRGTGGYGHLFQESIHTRLGAQEIADIREVLDQMHREAFVDPSRIGIWGAGYGGFIAVESLLDIHPGFKAGFAQSPVVDWRHYPAYFSERYLGLPQTNAFSYMDSSATRNARRIGGALMVTKMTPATELGSSQAASFLSAIDQAISRRPYLATHFHELDLQGDTATATADVRRQLFDGMTKFFDSTL